MTVMVRASVPEQVVASAPLIVNADGPAVVGVPVSRPAEVRLRPAGREPAETVKVKGETAPLAVNCWL